MTLAHRRKYMGTQMKSPIVQGTWWLLNITCKEIEVKGSLLHWKRVGVEQLRDELEGRRVTDCEDAGVLREF